MTVYNYVFEKKKNETVRKVVWKKNIIYIWIANCLEILQHQQPIHVPHIHKYTRYVMRF